VIDIRALAQPTEIAFIPYHLVGRVTEGMQAVRLSTRFFDGHVLITTSEPCGKSAGGISLIDVSNPLRPVPLSVHSGNSSGAGTTRSAFAWDAGDDAYAAVVGTASSDVDIFDITNPRRPKLIRSVNVNTLAGRRLDQPEIGLTDSSPRDVVARRLDATGDGEPEWVLLVAHGDGGFALVDVDDPTSPIFIADTDYQDPDPILLLRMGISSVPEGNAHYADLTSDGRFFIGTDEDLAPFDANDAFNGWGYVHLFDTLTLEPLDDFAIAEGHDPDFAFGFGRLSVHEVATDPDPAHPDLAYLSYYSGGLRAVQIQCADPNDPSTCRLVEVGGYLDPKGNDFFGIETFVTDDGKTIILASDRDSGLWIFRRE
jgi:hypothetical protein